MVDALEFGTLDATNKKSPKVAESPRHKILLLDNFDSFTYNLKYQLQEFGTVKTWRNDVALDKLIAQALASDLVVLSPGPGNPAKAGNLLALIKAVAGQVPMFGICLGHQALVEAFGGVIGPAPAILHGKTSDMQHAGDSLFRNLPKPLSIARYHSLVASEVPDNFQVTASVGGQVMAVEDKAQKLFGVQFHPESILTTYGQQLFSNVFACVGLEE
ncbi:MAG: aminodeoxychorismate/anthranilate synthase component II [Gammaproteobacteria bacterium]|nr:aminodeoxychorismate/anthranilate synthase component II [Gammaproteobacteria bacterium]NNC97817.1 aminodeoxychorismate/anthranilate synthase component II [Gammaproteobacteria bacterium]NNM13284.1 aminodeoxychorismate/anthranilate synthase component II [Gammaproteobacteria bacterium]